MVLAGDEVNVRIFHWWEENRPGDAGVQNKGIGVKPPVPIGISDSLLTFL